VTLRIEIPGLPPLACSPNSRHHWAVKARAATSWGETVFYHAIDARNRSEQPAKWKNLDGATLKVTYVVKDNRRRDTDNMDGANKSGIDALVRANILADDCWQKLNREKSRFEVDPKRAPMTIVEITCDR
jgi:Holliday junction resolvase RusA-like endonuclease